MEDLNKILKGIDKDQCESTDGWWETSTGAEFGAKKLKEIDQYVNQRVSEVLEKLEEKHRMSLDYNLIGEIGDIIKELKQ